MALNWDTKESWFAGYYDSSDASMVIWLALAEMAYVTRTLFFKNDLAARRCESDTSVILETGSILSLI